MPAVQQPQGITFQQIITVILFVLGIAWALTFWYIQDQTVQTRSLSKSDTEQRIKIDTLQQDVLKDKSKLEATVQNLTELKSSLAAIEPYNTQNRTLLTTVATSVSKQEDDVKYLISSVDEIKKLLQIVGKDQIALRSQYEVLKDTLPVKRTK